VPLLLLRCQLLQFQVCIICSNRYTSPLALSLLRRSALTKCIAAEQFQLIWQAPCIFAVLLFL
jgi:hypothetical protein